MARRRASSGAKAVTGPRVMRRSRPLARNWVTKNLRPEARTGRAARVADAVQSGRRAVPPVNGLPPGDDGIEKP